MPAIPFTQFLRPDGQRKQTYIEMPLSIALLAQRFIEEGGRYTSEMLLPSNQVAFCAEFGEGDERNDIACVIADNGPEVVAAVEKIIRYSFEYLQKIEVRDE